MLPGRQSTYMPIVVIARILGNPGIDFADLFAIEENVSPATFLGAATHDGNARAIKC
jgi:hypothetical protein